MCKIKSFFRFSLLFCAISIFCVCVFVSAFIFALNVYARSHKHILLVRLFLFAIQCTSFYAICMQVYFFFHKIFHVRTFARIFAFVHIYCSPWICEFDRFVLALFIVLISECVKSEKKWEEKRDGLWDWKSFEMATTTM